jgi:hypothetical protein
MNHSRNNYALIIIMHYLLLCIVYKFYEISIMFYAIFYEFYEIFLFLFFYYFSVSKLL